MVAPMTALEAQEVFFLFTRSILTVLDPVNLALIVNSPGVDQPYRAVGGIYREEAIMLLRRFYVQENAKGMDKASRTSNQKLITQQRLNRSQKETDN